MILVEIRPRGGGQRTTITVHPKITVVAGLDPAGRRAWATDLGRALQGGEADGFDVQVEVDGRPVPLTPEVASKLGLGDAGCEVTVFPLDLPGAAPATHVPDADAEAVVVDVEVDDDEGVLAARRALDEARQHVAELEQAAAAAMAERERVSRDVDPNAAAALPGLERALDAARAAVLNAQRAIEDVETRIQRVREVKEAERNEVREAIQQLRDERDRVEAERTAAADRLAGTPDPGEPKPVEDALAGLRRLRSVRAKPSPRALELADAWVEAYERLHALPAPPAPPEWLVSPALAALQEAKEAVAEAERGGPSVDVDPKQVHALDRAHREVLETEQRVMRKGSRTNRKRLDAAHEAEREALHALGVSTYGEYLQRIAPHLGDDGASREQRLAEARAALSDAQAVWEELHDGQASPEWTAAKQHQAEIRREAHALLDRDVDDADLEAALRGHVEAVVDTAWAEQALVEALEGAGVQLPVPDGEASATELEEIAERWLQEAPVQRAARAELEAEVAALDTRLAVVTEQYQARQSDAFVDDDEEDEDLPDSVAGSPSLSVLREQLAEADDAFTRAQRALEDAHARVAASDAASARLAELEREGGERRRALEEAHGRCATAEARVAEAREAAVRSARARAEEESKAKASANGAADLSRVSGMEAEAYLLARVTALRGAAAGPLPLIVDGAVLSGLSERASKRMYRLLSRLAASMQLVVLADDEETTSWAEGLGESAAVHSVAR